MFTKNLPATTGTEVAVVSPASSAIAKLSVTKAVSDGIKALQVSFPIMTQTPDDRVMVMQLHAEAIDGFEPSVQEFALRWLRLHNPRNTEKFTQPPTPQDLHEMCERVRNTWRARVQHFYMGMNTGYSHSSTAPGIWEDAPSYVTTKTKSLPYGPKPYEPGCYISERMIVDAMLAYTSLSYRTDDLVDLADGDYTKLRPEFFEPGRREEIDGLRKARNERIEAERKHLEYLDSLPVDVRNRRCRVLSKYERLEDLAKRRGETFEMPSEDVIIAEVMSTLAEEEEQRKATEAEASMQETEHWERMRKRAEARANDPKGYEQALRDRKVPEFYERNGADPWEEYLDRINRTRIDKGQPAGESVAA